jgi:hypothetical protein
MSDEEKNKSLSETLLAYPLFHLELETWNLELFYPYLKERHGGVRNYVAAGVVLSGH